MSDVAKQTSVSCRLPPPLRTVQVRPTTESVVATARREALEALGLMASSSAPVLSACRLCGKKSNCPTESAGALAWIRDAATRGWRIQMCPPRHGRRVDDSGPKPSRRRQVQRPTEGRAVPGSWAPRAARHEPLPPLPSLPHTEELVCPKCHAKTATPNPTVATRSTPSIENALSLLPVLNARAQAANRAALVQARVERGPLALTRPCLLERDEAVAEPRASRDTLRVIVSSLLKRMPRPSWDSHLSRRLAAIHPEQVTPRKWHCGRSLLPMGFGPASPASMYELIAEIGLSAVAGQACPKVLVVGQHWDEDMLADLTEFVNRHKKKLVLVMSQEMWLLDLIFSSSTAWWNPQSDTLSRLVADHSTLQQMGNALWKWSEDPGVASWGPMLLNAPQKGPLKLLGYNVDAQEALAPAVRQRKLRHAFENAPIGCVTGLDETWGNPKSHDRLFRIESSLARWLRWAQAKKDAPASAIKKWQADLIWLQGEFRTSDMQFPSPSSAPVE